jgi:hypothetical protein
MIYDNIMKNIFLLFLILMISLLSLPAFSQTADDTPLLGLPGDNLDLYAVLDIFQKSKTIEAFEKSLNEEKTGITNLDLNLDNKVDFIKVVTKQTDKSFSVILQVDISEKETQDVAVILIDKDKDENVTLQIVGDKDLYGDDYVVEPKTAATPAITANPAYTGDDPVTVSVPASTTVVVVETLPIVQYVYSPVYVPYYPPYHYSYYPPYFAAFTVVAVGIYRHNHYHRHRGYNGGHYRGGGNRVVIHNTNNFNNYNNSRHSSNTVKKNNANRNYNKNKVSNRSSTGASARPSKGDAGQLKDRSASSSPGSKDRPSTGSMERGNKQQRKDTSAFGGYNKGSQTRNSSNRGRQSMSSGRTRGGGGGKRR